MSTLMGRPEGTDKCAACKHPFNEHYVTYGHNKDGCTSYDTNYSSSGKCNCSGFTVKYTEKTVTGSYDNMGR